MGEIIESPRPKVLREESIAPDGRKESEGCLDILSLLPELDASGCRCLVLLRERGKGKGKGRVRVWVLMTMVDDLRSRVRAGPKSIRSARMDGWMDRWWDILREYDSRRRWVEFIQCSIIMVGIGCVLCCDVM